MADAAARRDELRAAADPADPAAAARALSHRLRSGEVTRPRVRLASFLGHPAARELEPLPRWAWVLKHGSMREWAKGVTSLASGLEPVGPVECPICYGKGSWTTTIVDSAGGGGASKTICVACGGTGRSSIPAAHWWGVLAGLAAAEWLMVNSALAIVLEHPAWQAAQDRVGQVRAWLNHPTRGNANACDMQHCLSGISGVISQVHSMVRVPGSTSLEAIAAAAAFMKPGYMVKRAVEDALVPRLLVFGKDGSALRERGR